MNQFLLALCGIPASGKTTLARDLLKLTSKEYIVRLVSTDDWRNQEYYDDFKPENENRVREKALNETKRFLKNGESVIHDDTNYYSSMRHELFSIAMEVECGFGIVYVNTPLKLALRWNTQREVVVPEHVISKISDRLDTPGSKYVWDTALYEVNLSQVSSHNAALEIVENIRNLQGLKPLLKSEAGKSELFDHITRNIVTDFLDQYQLYRNNPEVSRVRKDVLREALETNESIDETKKKLWRLLKRIEL